MPIKIKGLCGVSRGYGKDGVYHIVIYVDWYENARYADGFVGCKKCGELKALTDLEKLL